MRNIRFSLNHLERIIMKYVKPIEAKEYLPSNFSVRPSPDHALPRDSPQAVK